jgi:hypothetical protein
MKYLLALGVSMIILLMAFGRTRVFIIYERERRQKEALKEIQKKCTGSR